MVEKRRQKSKSVFDPSKLENAVSQSPDSLLPCFVLSFIDVNDTARSGSGRDGSPCRLVLMVCQTNNIGARAVARLDPRVFMDK